MDHHATGQHSFVLICLIAAVVGLAWPSRAQDSDANELVPPLVLPPQAQGPTSTSVTLQIPLDISNLHPDVSYVSIYCELAQSGRAGWGYVDMAANHAMARNTMDLHVEPQHGYNPVTFDPPRSGWLDDRIYYDSDAPSWSRPGGTPVRSPNEVAINWRCFLMIDRQTPLPPDDQACQGSPDMARCAAPLTPFRRVTSGLVEVEGEHWIATDLDHVIDPLVFVGRGQSLPSSARTGDADGQASPNAGGQAQPQGQPSTDQDERVDEAIASLGAPVAECGADLDLINDGISGVWRHLWGTSIIMHDPLAGDIVAIRHEIYPGADQAYRPGQVIMRGRVAGPDSIEGRYVWQQPSGLAEECREPYGYDFPASLEQDGIMLRGTAQAPAFGAQPCTPPGFDPDNPAHTVAAEIDFVCVELNHQRAAALFDRHGVAFANQTLPPEPLEAPVIPSAADLSGDERSVEEAPGPEYYGGEPDDAPESERTAPDNNEGPQPGGSEEPGKPSPSQQGTAPSMPLPPLRVLPPGIMAPQPAPMPVTPVPDPVEENDGNPIIPPGFGMDDLIPNEGSSKPLDQSGTGQGEDGPQDEDQGGEPTGGAGGWRWGGEGGSLWGSWGLQYPF